eukprot:CAMPEP_0196666616 /NCGR_PEP_ID=MMETSP1086-20130531/64615_1 /TAXON_ID=77921 /ORGANISM="Cyanoptyche  gloeocystis , Strain SAG4.97" /LENGTH=391 /DNA_ID=CAMNT_0042003831 /DNA_START=298 /DNA_END=1473 /DNA_ORIENTATION=+
MWEVERVVYSLRQVEFSNCSVLDSRMLRWLRGCSSLRQLCLTGCARVLSSSSLLHACSSFEAFGPLLKRLEVLDMGDSLVPLEAIGKMNAPYLHTLKISAYPLIQAAPVGGFFRMFPKLERLTINDGGRVSGFYSLSSLGLPTHLKELNAPGFPLLLRGFDSVSAFPELRVLNIRAILETPDAADWIPQLPKLRALAFIQKGSHLRFLHLDLSQAVLLESLQLSLKAACIPPDVGLANLKCLSEIKLRGSFDVDAVCIALSRSPNLKNVDITVRSKADISSLGALQSRPFLEHCVVAKNYDSNSSTSCPGTIFHSVPYKVKLVISGNGMRSASYPYRRGKGFRHFFQMYCGQQRIRREDFVFFFKGRVVSDIWSSDQLGWTGDIHLTCSRV